MFLFEVYESTMIITSYMRRLISMEPEKINQAMNRIRKEFERVSNILEKWEYLEDGRGSNACLGGADISFSALAAWLILPDIFHNGQIGVVPKPSQLAVPMQTFRNELLKTGTRCCYGKHRKDEVVVIKSAE